MKEEDYTSWKALANNGGEHLTTIDGTSLLTTCLVPRPTAWISVYPSSSTTDNGEQQQQPLVALVEGYCGASDRPPTLMLGSDSIPPAILNGLRANGVCSLSIATERESVAAKQMAASNNEMCGPAETFQHASLQPCSSTPSVLEDLPIPSPEETSQTSANYFKRPPAVDTSPVHMHCRLVLDVPLLEQTNDDDDDDDDDARIPSMLLLQIDTYIIKGCILRNQTTLSPQTTTIHGNPDVRRISAKIDCLLLKPLASLGNKNFGKVECIHHMGRPRPLSRRSNECKNTDALSKSQMLINSCKPDIDTGDDESELNEDSCNNVDWESNKQWEIDDLIPVDSIYDMGFNNKGDGETISYTYRRDNSCPLGYNPMKQVVCPRFIGWISTYEPTSLLSGNRKNTEPIPHISPYSFFMDVSRGDHPMVAFAACPRSDEFTNAESDESTGNSSNNWKDAQRDAEETGVFCVNIVSQDLAWAMNASAAPLGKGLSEFRLMEGGNACDSGCANSSCFDEYHRKRIVPTPMKAPSVNAPFVPQSPMFMECRYVKTGKTSCVVFERIVLCTSLKVLQ